MRELKSMSNVTFRRQGYVLLGDLELPIYTIGLIDYKRELRSIKNNSKLPMTEKLANADEKKALSKFSYDMNQLQLRIKEIDKTSDKYAEFENFLDKKEEFIEIALNVDMNYKAGELEFWQILELKDDKDYVGLINWLAELGMIREQISIVIQTINMIKLSNFKTYEEYESAILSDKDAE